MKREEVAETLGLEMMIGNDIITVIVTYVEIAKNSELSHLSFLTFVFIKTNVLQLKVEQICGK